MNQLDPQYISLLEDILANGEYKENRTGVNTRSTTSRMLRHNMKDGFPALNSKRVFIRGAIEEQLQFMRGDTNTLHLEEKGINYWKGNTSREFLDSRGLYSLPVGDLGCSYPHQYRNFGGEHPYIKETKGCEGFDQLKHVVHLLKHEPDSRKILINLFNPQQMKYAALEPCHYAIQFIANKEKKELSLCFNMRSSDTFLGLPVNLVMYGFFLEVIAKLIDYEPKELIYYGVDVHIYENHKEHIKTLKEREIRPLTKLKIKKEINSLDDILSLKWEEDYYLENYNPHKIIKADMAI